MNIVSFILVGLVVGWISSVLIEGHGFGFLGNTIIGIAGAFVGGLAFDSFSNLEYGLWGSVGTALVGAIVLLFFADLLSQAYKSRSVLQKKH
jgi:uncharacterized membrane protein YeaQ/YmgE (transglycosylase-associated protein family)